MNLAVFDIDGTLTDTQEVDSLCFVRALELEFGIRSVDDDWSLYTHATDPGIFGQVYHQKRGRLPGKDEVEAFKVRFLDLLKEAWRLDCGQFAEIAGASAMLGRIKSKPDWTAALATGGWAMTARFKLEAAGLPFEELPFASGDDGISREEIISVAIKRARGSAGVENFSNIVSFGDGVWDVKAARALNLAFIGVGDREKLGKAGADVVVPDFKKGIRGLFL